MALLHFMCYGFICFGRGLGGCGGIHWYPIPLSSMPLYITDAHMFTLTSKYIIWLFRYADLWFLLLYSQMYHVLWVFFYLFIFLSQRSCQEGGQTLERCGEWESLLEFALTGWRCTSELPQWDTASHNVIREHCYSMLAKHCSTALRHHQPAPSKVREMLRRWETHFIFPIVVLFCLRLNLLRSTYGVEVWGFESMHTHTF